MTVERKSNHLNLIILYICGTIISLSFVLGFVYHSINDRTLMAKNIENAITKGIDPLTVRCSYAKSDDIICIAYAASDSSHPTQTATNSVKK
jgi:hypothetical protein